MKTRMTAVGAILFAALLLALPILAQETVEPGEEEEGGVYMETVDVNVVNIDVFVTDKKGNVITGLTKDDFEIFEDKRQVQITNFYVVEGGLQPGEEPRSASARIDPLAPVEPTLDLPEEHRLHLVVYIDNFNIRPFNRNRVFRRLREFLRENLGSDDRVMLVSYDRSLHVRHQFTTDAGLVASALYELEGLTGNAVHFDSERRDLIRDIFDAENSVDVTWRIRQFAESRFNDISFSLDGLNEIIDSLAGLSGRKALLYVSDGIPMTPGEDLYLLVSQRFQGQQSIMSTAREFDMSRRYQLLGAKANTNRVTFYAIDAAGLRVSSTSSVEMEAAPEPGTMNFVDSMYTSNLQQPILMMADITGGQVIYNTNDVGPGLTKIARDFDSYYSLGYSPGHSGSGKYYKIKVTIPGRKKLRIRYREGYRDKPVLARMSDRTMSTLQYGFESNPLEIIVRFGDGERVDRDEFEIPFMVGIPLDKIVLIPRDGFQEGRLKLYFAAVDEKGRFSEVQEVRLPVNVPDENLKEGARQYFPYQDKLRMRGGRHRLAVGVWDELSGEGAFVTESVLAGGTGG